MQSIRMLAALAGALVLGSACGGYDGGTGPNTAPVANFTAPACTTGTACTFTDASTDDVAVTGWDWDFGDGTTPHGTTASPSHTYAASGTYNVKLTVTDGGGLTGEKTVAVTVTRHSPTGCWLHVQLRCWQLHVHQHQHGDYRFIRVGFGPASFPVQPTSRALERPDAQLHRLQAQPTSPSRSPSRTALVPRTWKRRR